MGGLYDKLWFQFSALLRWYDHASVAHNKFAELWYSELTQLSAEYVHTSPMTQQHQRWKNLQKSIPELSTQTAYFILPTPETDRWSVKPKSPFFIRNPEVHPVFTTALNYSTFSHSMSLKISFNIIFPSGLFLSCSLKFCKHFSSVPCSVYPNHLINLHFITVTNETPMFTKCALCHFTYLIGFMQICHCKLNKHTIHYTAHTHILLLINCSYRILSGLRFGQSVNWGPIPTRAGEFSLLQGVKTGSEAYHKSFLEFKVDRAWTLPLSFSYSTAICSMFTCSHARTHTHTPMDDFCTYTQTKLHDTLQHLVGCLCAHQLHAVPGHGTLDVSTYTATGQTETDF